MARGSDSSTEVSRTKVLAVVLAGTCGSLRRAGGRGLLAIGSAGTGPEERGPGPALRSERQLHQPGLPHVRRVPGVRTDGTSRPWMSTHLGPGVSRVTSATEPALPVRVRAERPEEVDVPEVRPVRLTEVELRLRALPEQEPPQPLLARRADDEVRVGLALGVEVLGDLLDGDRVGDLVHRGALRRVLVDEGAD